MIDQASNPLRLSATLLGLGRARPLQFFISSGSVFSHYLLQLAPGLLLQAFFDDLTGRQPARLGPYTLLALLAGVAIMAGIQGIANTAEPTLRQAEIERAKRKRPDSLDAYDLYLRALADAFAGMPEPVDRALALLEQAVAIEPDYGAAHGAIAVCQRPNRCFFA